jgi:hypothetical protein
LPAAPKNDEKKEVELEVSGIPVGSVVLAGAATEREGRKSAQGMMVVRSHLKMRCGGCRCLFIVALVWVPGRREKERRFNGLWVFMY